MKIFITMLVPVYLLSAPGVADACGLGSVGAASARVAAAVQDGNDEEVARTVSIIASGALGGTELGVASIPVTGGVGPVVGAIIGAACGCAVSNKTAPAP